MCVLCIFFSNLFLYNTALSVLFCVNTDMIIIAVCVLVYYMYMGEF